MKETIGSTTGSRENMRKKAEVFATYLLFQKKKLNILLKQVKESPDPIPELAKEFQI
jgi:Zn-dependent peptidase ImmA (M78 family)